MKTLTDNQLIAARSRRRVLAAFGALPVTLSGFLSACASNPNRIDPPAAAPVQPKAVRSGERWRYQRINRYNDEPLGEILAEVTQVQPRLVVRLTGQDGRLWGEEIYSEPWQVIQEPTYNELLRFSEPVRLLPPELKPGQSARQRTGYQVDGHSARRGWDARLSVSGWERITVPAGQFDCLRIDRTIYFEPRQLGRFNARRVESLWYAPAVTRWVRRDWTGFYLDETTISDRRTALPIEEREDSVSWVLLEHQAAPVSG